jgi:hypothetical protein
VASSSASTFSASEERERSKDRLKDLTIAPLPPSGEELREWVINLKWSLVGDCWCYNGQHATEITVTTPATQSLSNDLLAIIKKAATAHSNPSYQKNAPSLLQDNINDVNGTELMTHYTTFALSLASPAVWERKPYPISPNM